MPVSGTIGPEGGPSVPPLTDVASIDGLVVVTTELDPERPTVWSSNGAGWVAQPIELAMGVTAWDDRFVTVGNGGSISSPVQPGG